MEMRIMNNANLINEVDFIRNNLINEFPNCKVKVTDGIGNNCKYNILLVTDQGTRIEQRYGNLENALETNYPNTIEEITLDLISIYTTIQNVTIEVIKDDRIKEFKCIEYRSTDSIENNQFIFSFTTKDNEKEYEEAYNPYEQSEEEFINVISQYTTTKLKGKVDIESLWGYEYYINGINIQQLLMKALEQGKEVSLEILN